MSSNTPAPREKPRVLILASQPADFRSTVNYLNRRDYDVELSRSLNEALESIALGQCQYLLLSIDFPGSRCEILPQVLEQSFNVAVIVFAEKQDRKNIQKLSTLRAKNILFNQPSGPTILARIKQIWLPDKRKSDVMVLVQKGSTDEEKTLLAGEKLVSAKEVASQLLAKLNRHFPHSEPQQLKEKTIAEAAVDVQTEAAPVISRVRTRRETPTTEFDPHGNKIGERPLFETKLQETIFDSAERSLADVCPSNSKLSYMMGPIAEAELLCIDAVNFKGTFVVAYSCDEGSSDGSPLYAAEAKLIEDLKVHGFHIRDEDLTVLPMSDFDLPANLINSAELVITRSCRQFDVSFGFFSSTRLIPMFERLEDPIQMIDIGQFAAGTTLNVDVFLPMPLNNKFVRYWRRGSKVTEDQLNKVVGHGTLQLGVRTDQLDLFSQYCAYQSIQAEANRFHTVRTKRKSAA